MKILAILQARCSSKRLPNKVMMDILGKPMIQHQIERIALSKKIDQLVIATSNQSEDNLLVEMCENINVNVYRGKLDDVLDRFYQSAKRYNADVVIRLTGDCPLIDPVLIDKVIEKHLIDKNDYTSNLDPESFPDGLDVEVFNFSILEEAWRYAVSLTDREHVTIYIRNKKNIKKGTLISEIDYSTMRWTVDEARDFEFVSEIYSQLSDKGNMFSSQDIYELLGKNPELQNINSEIQRNEGLIKSLKRDLDSENKK